MPRLISSFVDARPDYGAALTHCQRQRGAKSIAWVDAPSYDEWVPGPGGNAELVQSRFHGREAGSGTHGPLPQ